MLARAIGRFSRDEQGGLSNLLLPMFLLLVITSGLAIDLVMNESNRACLQNAMDRGVLAATSLSQTEDPQDVVLDYVNKQGCDDSTLFFPRGNAGAATAENAAFVDVNVTENASSRRIVASTSMDHETAVMSLLPGIGTYVLNVPASAEALEGVENVEVSLILDISGSMARNTAKNTDEKRLKVLRTAAKQFVTDLLTGEDRQNVSISLIPYAGQVNAGPFFDPILQGTRDHDYSACIEFTDTDYATAQLPALNSRSQVPSFQWFTYEGPEGRGHEAEWGWCPKSKAAIIPFTKNLNALKTAIDGLMAHDGTGTQNGMKWGLGLLDPSARPLVQSVAALPNSPVSPAFAGRPYDYGTPGTQKIIVVMTDGNIRYQNRPDPTKFTSSKDAEYWGKEPLRTTKYGYTFVENVMSFRWSGAGYNNPSYSTQPNFEILSNVDEPLRTQQFLNLCNMAKDRNIRIFTIGFDISETSDAYSEMQACASTPSDFFFVEGLDLAAAFAQIASLVQDLRLVR